MCFDWQTPKTPAILFDLDGTLLDSNYEYIRAWREAFRTGGVEIPNARIHRCVGMSGRLMIQALFTEIERNASPQTIEHLDQLHKRNFTKTLSSVQALVGARELLKDLFRRGGKMSDCDRRRPRNR